MQGSITTHSEITKEEQMVSDITCLLRVLGDTFRSDYSEIEKQLNIDLYVFNRDKLDVLAKPLIGEQLRQADGVCPRHHIELEISEYGNPDADKVCPKCEAELQEVA